MSNFVIVGNGCDVFHGLNTRYDNFIKYLESNEPDLALLFRKLLNVTDEDKKPWNDFEKKLSELDIEALINNAREDHRNNDSLYVLKHSLELLERLWEHLRDWIRDLSPRSNDKAVDFIDYDDYILCFNYTRTVEEVYGVVASQICYIHNVVKDDFDPDIDWFVGYKNPEVSGYYDRPIFGHGKNESRKYIDSTPPYPSAEGIDMQPTYESLAYNTTVQDLNDYFWKSFKDTEETISHLESFLNCAKDCENVYVFGHSISDVDMDYFKMITSSFGLSVNYFVTFFDERERPVMEEKLRGLLGEGASISFIDSKKL